VNVSGVELMEVEFIDGSFVVKEGTEQVLPADVVLLALGFTGAEPAPYVEQLGLDLDPRGNIVRNVDFTTNVEGIYVAGDAGRGQSLIVWAIAEGRAAAASVDSYLMGSTNLPSPIRATDRPLTV
jgi:glutamate synthase (NADPH/NADH) small chain